MPNSAHELADLLQSWLIIPSGQTVRVSRGMQGDAIEGWRLQVHATVLLRDVDKYLTGAQLAKRNVDHFLRAYPAWTAGVFAPDLVWNQGTQGNKLIMAQHHIDLLRALGDIMDSTEISVSMSTEQSAEGVSAVDALLDVLNDPEVHLTEGERRYVYELISSVRRVFEESKVLGSVDLLRSVHELLGVMTMLAETLAEDPATKTIAKKIMQAARRIVPYATFGAKVSAGTIGVAADILQITSGGS